MDTASRIVTYLIAAIFGTCLLGVGLRMTDTDPKSQHAKGRSEGYQQVVKDCMTGRAKVEIRADTLIVVP